MRKEYYKGLLASRRSFEIGQRVALKRLKSFNSSALMVYHQGKVGTIKRTRGRCYQVLVQGSKAVGYKTIVAKAHQLVPLR